MKGLQVFNKDLPRLKQFAQIVLSGDILPRGTPMADCIIAEAIAAAAKTGCLDEDWLGFSPTVKATTMVQNVPTDSTQTIGGIWNKFKEDLRNIWRKKS